MAAERARGLSASTPGIAPAAAGARHCVCVHAWCVQHAINLGQLAGVRVHVR